MFDNRYRTNKNEHNSSLKQLLWIRDVQLMHDTGKKINHS